MNIHKLQAQLKEIDQLYKDGSVEATISGESESSGSLVISATAPAAVEKVGFHAAPIETLLRPPHARAKLNSVRRALRQAWELNDAAKAEKLIRNLAQRLERDAPGVSKSILEGLDEILTVSRLGLPAELRRSLACTNIIENMMGTVRRVTRNVKRWSSPSMALRWTAAAMHEAKKGFRRLKAFRQLPALRAALAAHYEKETNSHAVAQNAKAA